MSYFVIDVGGNFIKSACVEEGGEKIQKLPVCKTPETKEAFIRVLEKVLDNLPVKSKGVAISHTGIVDNSEGKVVFNGSLPFLKGFNYRSFIQANFNIPVAIINDGQAAVLAESHTGALKGIKNGATLALGTGLALGIIMNGQLYQGANNIAGEVSFLLSSYHDVPLVRRAGIFNFIRPANEILGNKDLDDARLVFEAIKNEESPEVLQMFEEYSQIIANLIYNLHVILDLECIAIGGGVSSEPLLIDKIRELYLELYRQHPSFVFREEIFQPVPLTVCRFKNDANLLGALFYLKETYNEIQ